METAEVSPAADADLGLFVLPAISPEVPYVMEQASERSRTLARFALAGEACGLALPGGPSQSLEDVVAQQWTIYMHSISERLGATMLGSPSVLVTDERLSILIGARSDINTYRLKPVVESLEQSMKGLGWFITSVLNLAGRNGLYMYDMAMVAYHLDGRMTELDEFTDQHYARHLLADEGERDYDDESEVSDQKIEELRLNYQHWPSDILQMVDGHVHLLGAISYGAASRTEKVDPPASETQVKRWLKANADHPQAQCVKAAMALHAALQAKDAPDFSFYPAEDDVESIGAMCFIAWDDPYLLWESAGHAEEMAYNGGDVVEAFARKNVSLVGGITDQQLADLVTETKNYLKTWHLLEQLMSNLPALGDDDEI